MLQLMILWWLLLGLDVSLALPMNEEVVQQSDSLSTPEPYVTDTPNSLSDLPKELVQKIATKFAVADRIRFRASATAHTVGGSAEIPYLAVELFAKTSPLLNADNPFLLYRFCIQKFSTVVSKHFSSVAECLDSMDAYYLMRLSSFVPSSESPSMPPLSVVKVQTAYDLVRGRLGNILYLPILIILTYLIQDAESWSVYQSRALLFYLAQYAHVSWFHQAWNRFCFPTTKSHLLTGSSTSVLDKIDCIIIWGEFFGKLPDLEDPTISHIGPVDRASFARAQAQYTRSCHVLCNVVIPSFDREQRFYTAIRERGNIHTECNSDSDTEDEEGDGPLLPTIILGAFESLISMKNMQDFSAQEFDKFVQELSLMGVDWNHVFFYGSTFLHLTLRRSVMRYWNHKENPPSIKSMIMYGALPNKVDRQGESCLDMALRSGNARNAQLLLENGADPDTLNRNKLTPLMQVTSGALAHLLLYFRASPFTVGYNGLNALMVAVKANALEVVDVLTRFYETLVHSRNSRDETPLMMAEDLQILVLLLKRGSKVDAQDNQGNTALHRATVAHDTGIMRLLIRFGANPKIKNQAGVSPLDLAFRMRNERILYYLLQDERCFSSYCV